VIKQNSLFDVNARISPFSDGVAWWVHRGCVLRVCKLLEPSTDSAFCRTTCDRVDEEETSTAKATSTVETALKNTADTNEAATRETVTAMQEMEPRSRLQSVRRLISPASSARSVTAAPALHANYILYVDVSKERSLLETLRVFEHFPVHRHLHRWRRFYLRGQYIAVVYER
jgi:hypothetical protein